MARFTQAWIDRQKPKAKRYSVRVPEVPGLFLRVTPSGTRTFTVVARSPYGEKKPRWHELLIEERKGKPRVPVVLNSHTADQIADAARAAIRRIRSGQSAFPLPDAEPDTFRVTAESWIKKHVREKGLRSADEIERRLETLVYPDFGARVFTAIKRRDVADLLDAIAERHGARTANLVLGDLRSLMNWYAARSDDYSTVIVPRMAKELRKGAKPKRGPVSSGGRRNRVLSDDELRLLWPIFGERGTFGAILKLALLTAQRADKLATMRWADLHDGVWTIQTAEREKGNPGKLALPQMALDVINEQPRIGRNPYVFSGRSKRPEGGKEVDAAELARPFNGWSKCKKALEEAVLEVLRGQARERGDDVKKVKPLERWVVHDLRHTAKTLMERAGVSRFHSERALGHVVPGIEGRYNQHDYFAENTQALATLAVLLSRIIAPPADNVVAAAFKREAVA